MIDEQTIEARANAEATLPPPVRSAAKVLIVGASLTGLTLACEFARRGVSRRLLEAVPGPQLGSRGKGLQPRTLEVFDNLGVVGHMLSCGQIAMPMRVTALDGQTMHGGTEIYWRPP